MQIIKSILRVPMFYTSLLAFAHALIAAFMPTIPQGVILAGDGLVLVIAGIVTGQQVIIDRREQAQATRAVEARDAAGQANYAAYVSTYPNAGQFAKWDDLPQAARRAWSIAAQVDTNERATN